MLRQSVGIYQETSSHATRQGTLSQSSQLAEPLWTNPGIKSGISASYPHLKSAGGEWIVEHSPRILAREEKATTRRHARKFAYLTININAVHMDSVPLRYFHSTDLIHCAGLEWCKVESTQKTEVVLVGKPILWPFPSFPKIPFDRALSFLCRVNPHFWVGSTSPLGATA